MEVVVVVVQEEEEERGGKRSRSKEAPGLLRRGGASSGCFLCLDEDPAHNQEKKVNLFCRVSVLGRTIDYELFVMIGSNNRRRTRDLTPMLGVLLAGRGLSRSQRLSLLLSLATVGGWSCS